MLVYFFIPKTLFAHKDNMIYLCKKIHLMTFLFISYSEIFVIIFVMLLIFGPDKMPEIARNLGKGIRQLRDATSGVKKEILKETQKAGIDTEAVDKLKKQIKDSKKIMNIKEELNPISQIKDEITNTIKRS